MLHLDNTILEVKNLHTYFNTEEGVVKAVNGVSFSVEKGKTLGIMGESGSGKSISSLSIMRLIPMSPGKIAEGEIIFRDTDLLKTTEANMRHIRGNDIAMIFQEPMTSLNPVMKVGNQISEAILWHKGTTAKEAKEQTIELLRLVKIPNPDKRYNDYPHQMSGGMRQRVMIAMALSCSPEILICDEPTTALDVTMQAQILDLINELKEKIGAAVIMITHDMGVIAEMAEEVIVMYAGKIVEHGAIDDLFQNPRHPYTEGLLASIPKLNRADEKLKSIRGMVPKATRMPRGCAFNPRCDYAMDICRAEEPESIKTDGRIVSCHLRK